MREQEYNMKLQRIVTLEKELKTNLDGLKKKQSDIESREKELESRNIKIKEREERLKNLVEDEKQRSDRKIQITTKEFRTEIKELTNQNKALSEKLKNLEGYDQESKTIRKEHEKHQSLLKNEKDKNENSTRKILELEAKLEQGLKAQLFYKTAFENAEKKIKELVEENDRNKSNQIVDQKQEIQRLRAELMVTQQRNEDKWKHFSTVGNIQEPSRMQHSSMSPSLPVSESLNDTITVLPANAAANKENAQSNNKGPLNFGTHPSGPNKPSIDIKKQLSMLEKEKAMFLKTKVYNEEDPIVIQLNEKIKSLRCQINGGS